MELDGEALLDMLIAHYDAEDLVKLLEIDAEELLYRFSDRLESMSYKFEAED